MQVVCSQRMSIPFTADPVALYRSIRQLNPSPYIYYLTQNELFIGVGNFNHGFRTPSSIFYLNSLYYLPFVNYYFFKLGAILIMGFTVFIFLINIETSLKKKNYNFAQMFE